MKLRLTGAAFCGVIVYSLLMPRAEAVPLGLSLDPSPLIFADNINVGYDSVSDTLRVGVPAGGGLAQTIEHDGIAPAETISSGGFSIEATIDSSGNASVGNLLISGNVPTLGYNSGTLLQGTLTDFGFPGGGGDPLEFVFTVTGGDAAGLFSSGEALVILNLNGGFTGSFRENFNNRSFAGTARVGERTGSVPEISATLPLVAIAVFGLILMGRKVAPKVEI